MNEVAIIDGTRTPIGGFGGAFKDVSASDLGAVAIRESLRSFGVTERKKDTQSM